MDIDDVNRIYFEFLYCTNCFKHSTCQIIQNGTPQGISLSPTLFNMVVNQLLKLDLGRGIQMIEYADELAINISNLGETALQKRTATALERIGYKTTHLWLKFSPNRCEAIWHRIQNPECHFRISGEEIPWKSSVKYLGVIIDKGLKFRKQVDYVEQKTDRKMNAMKVSCSWSDVNTAVLKIYIHFDSTVHNGILCGNFWTHDPNTMNKLQVIQNQDMRCILGTPRPTSTTMMRQELHMLPVSHRAQLHRFKPFHKIKTNTKHLLHTEINTSQWNCITSAE